MRAAAPGLSLHAYTFKMAARILTRLLCFGAYCVLVSGERIAGAAVGGAANDIAMRNCRAATQDVDKRGLRSPDGPSMLAR